MDFGTIDIFTMSSVPIHELGMSMAKTSKTMLDRGGKGGYPSFVPHLRGKAFSLSPLSMMIAVGSCKFPLSGWVSFYS